MFSLLEFSVPAILAAEDTLVAAPLEFDAVTQVLWMIDWKWDSVTVLSYFSLLRHHQSMLEGVFNTSDIAYYLLLIVGFLVLTIRQLDRERLL